MESVLEVFRNRVVGGKFPHLSDEKFRTHTTKLLKEDDDVLLSILYEVACISNDAESRNEHTIMFECRKKILTYSEDGDKESHIRAAVDRSVRENDRRALFVFKEFTSYQTLDNDIVGVFKDKAVDGCFQHLYRQMELANHVDTLLKESDNVLSTILYELICIYNDCLQRCLYRSTLVSKRLTAMNTNPLYMDGIKDACHRCIGDCNHKLISAMKDLDLCRFEPLKVEKKKPYPPYPSNEEEEHVIKLLRRGDRMGIKRLIVRDKRTIDVLNKFYYVSKNVRTLKTVLNLIGKDKIRPMEDTEVRCNKQVLNEILGRNLVHPRVLASLYLKERIQRVGTWLIGRSIDGVFPDLSYCEFMDETLPLVTARDEELVPLLYELVCVYNDAVKRGMCERILQVDSRLRSLFSNKEYADIVDEVRNRCARNDDLTYIVKVLTRNTERDPRLLSRVKCLIRENKDEELRELTRSNMGIIDILKDYYFVSPNVSALVMVLSITDGVYNRLSLDRIESLLTESNRDVIDWMIDNGAISQGIASYCLGIATELESTGVVIKPGIVCSLFMYVD